MALQNAAKWRFRSEQNGDCIQQVIDVSDIPAHVFVDKVPALLARKSRGPRVGQTFSKRPLIFLGFLSPTPPSSERPARSSDALKCRFCFDPKPPMAIVRYRAIQSNLREHPLMCLRGKERPGASGRAFNTRQSG